MRLVLVSGPEAGSEVPFEETLTIGRDPTCGLVLDDAKGGRRHATLRVDDDGLSITDEQSRNGTWVNDRRVDGVTRLAHEDHLRIGSSEMRVEFADGRSNGTTTGDPLATPLDTGVTTAPTPPPADSTPPDASAGAATPTQAEVPSEPATPAAQEVPSEPLTPAASAPPGVSAEPAAPAPPKVPPEPVTPTTPGAAAGAAIAAPQADAVRVNNQSVTPARATAQRWCNAVGQASAGNSVPIRVPTRTIKPATPMRSSRSRTAP